MALITEAFLILVLLTVVKYSASLSLGRSIRVGKYRLRPVILFRQPQPDYVEEEPFPFYPESSVQESSYPEYDEYYSGGKSDYDSFAQLYDKTDNFVQSLQHDASAYIRPISTVPPTTTTLNSFETTAMPHPTSSVHRFSRGQKEFPLLRPPTETRRSAPSANEETYGVVKTFASDRTKPAEKNFADILSAELERLKPGAH